MPKLEKIPFTFKNEVVNGKAVITLSGSVATEDWYFSEDVINEKMLSKALTGIEGDILIRLNSPGGDVFEGVAIYNYLKSLPNHITVEVTALAASAASIIAMGADKIIMNTGSMMMIHEASTFTWGNKSDIRKTMNALETIDKSLVKIYQDRSGQSEMEINSLLEGETWFTAEEAVSFGFADEIKPVVGQSQDNHTDDEPENSLESRFEHLIDNAIKKYFDNHQIKNSQEEKVVEKPNKLQKLVSIYKER